MIYDIYFNIMVRVFVIISFARDLKCFFWTFWATLKSFLEIFGKIRGSEIFEIIL